VCESGGVDVFRDWWGCENVVQVWGNVGAYKEERSELFSLYDRVLDTAEIFGGGFLQRQSLTSFARLLGGVNGLLTRNDGGQSLELAPLGGLESIDVPSFYLRFYS
jgi:hypothetical protein